MSGKLAASMVFTLLVLLASGSARAQDMPGVGPNGIKIGNTNPQSGPASAYAAIAEGAAAYFRMIGDLGGVRGRKIDFISLDDGYMPEQTVEQTHRLVEQEGVAFLFNSVGTPTNLAVQPYLNDRRVPQLFVASGADRWGNYKEFPWTMGWQPSTRIEAQIYAQYILAEKPDAKIAILYQDDDFGRDYIAGVRDVLGDKFDGMVVMAPYKVTDPTVVPQLATLQASGANVLITAATPKFATQTIRRVHDMGWKPLHFLTNVSISVGSVIEPAGPEMATGIITASFMKDPSDPTWRDDAGMQAYKTFFRRYLPGARVSDNFYELGYSASMTLVEVLKQCGNDLTRENVMRQAANLHDLHLPTLLPGITINTSPTNYHPIRQMQLARWTGSTWQLFGKVIDGPGL